MVERLGEILGKILGEVLGERSWTRIWVKVWVRLGGWMRYDVKDLTNISHYISPMAE